jgi:superfamily I DNA and/or RNA helicase
VADVRRLNVAITRAKRALWVLGNCRALESNATWSALIGTSEEAVG